MWTIKVLLALVLFTVFLQDLRERKVYVFLFPAIGILCGTLFYKSTLPELFLSSIATNTVFVSSIVLVASLYARFKLRARVLSTIGPGDILMFLAVSASFPTVPFTVIFIGALVFSLALHLYLAKGQKAVTVPLAGHMGLFFMASYIGHWAGLVNALYTM